MMRLIPSFMVFWYVCGPQSIVATAVVVYLTKKSNFIKHMDKVAVAEFPVPYFNSFVSFFFFALLQYEMYVHSLSLSLCHTIRVQYNLSNEMFVAVHKYLF